jgi:MarR family transcriptional regulator, temperature-dependent positive regulator of motility
VDGIVTADFEGLRLAKALYGLRRKRDSVSGRPSLFAEPAWDILLDLYIAHCRRADIQVSSVCLDAGVPSTTILRWIARLEDEGLIFREPDGSDARRRYVRLTDEGQLMMKNVLCAVSTFAVT